jgi:hypothetical protein
MDELELLYEVPALEAHPDDLLAPLRDAIQNWCARSKAPIAQLGGRTIRGPSHSWYRLARLAHVSPPTVSRLMAGCPIGPAQAARIAWALKLRWTLVSMYSR